MRLEPQRQVRSQAGAWERGREWEMEPGNDGSEEPFAALPLRGSICPKILSIQRKISESIADLT